MGGVPEFQSDEFEQCERWYLARRRERRLPVWRERSKDLGNPFGDLLIRRVGVRECAGSRRSEKRLASWRKRPKDLGNPLGNLFVGRIGAVECALADPAPRAAGPVSRAPSLLPPRGACVSLRSARGSQGKALRPKKRGCGRGPRSQRSGTEPSSESERATGGKWGPRPQPLA